MGSRGAIGLVIQASVAWGGLGLERGWGKWLRGKGGFMEKECDQRFEIETQTVSAELEDCACAPGIKSPWNRLFETVVCLRPDRILFDKVESVIYSVASYYSCVEVNQVPRFIQPV